MKPHKLESKIFYLLLRGMFRCLLVLFCFCILCKSTQVTQFYSYTLLVFVYLSFSILVKESQQERIRTSSLTNPNRAIYLLIYLLVFVAVCISVTLHQNVCRLRLITPKPDDLEPSWLNELLGAWGRTRSSAILMRIARERLQGNSCRLRRFIHRPLSWSANSPNGDETVRQSFLPFQGKVRHYSGECIVTSSGYIFPACRLRCHSGIPPDR